MKQYLTTDISGASYTFNAAAKTVTFTGTIPTFGQILAILNVTRGVMIYNPSRAATNGTYASPVLTLTYDTTAHANADVLEIIVDQPAASLAADTSTAGKVIGTVRSQDVSELLTLILYELRALRIQTAEGMNLRFEETDSLIQYPNT